MTNIKDLENRLWEAADHMRANSPLRLNEFAEPVLGLIFLKFAGCRLACVIFQGFRVDKGVPIVQFLEDTVPLGSHFFQD